MMHCVTPRRCDISSALVTSINDNQMLFRRQPPVWIEMFQNYPNYVRDREEVQRENGATDYC